MKEKMSPPVRRLSLSRERKRAHEGRGRGRDSKRGLGARGGGSRARSRQGSTAGRKGRRWQCLRLCGCGVDTHWTVTDSESVPFHSWNKAQEAWRALSAKYQPRTADTSRSILRATLESALAKDFMPVDNL